MEECKGFRHPHYVQEKEKPKMRNLAASPSEADGDGNPSEYLPTDASAGANHRANSTGDLPYLSDNSTESEDLEDALEPNPIERLVTQQSLHTVEKSETLFIEPTKTAEGVILVDWYTTGEQICRRRYLTNQSNIDYGRRPRKPSELGHG